MKISKTMKKAMLSIVIAVGSLGAMSFTAAQVGVCVKQQISLNDGTAITAYYVQEV